MWCQSCDKELVEGAAFCASCGHAANRAGTPPPARVESSHSSYAGLGSNAPALNGRKATVLVGATAAMVVLVGATAVFTLVVSRAWSALPGQADSPTKGSSSTMPSPSAKPTGPSDDEIGWAITSMLKAGLPTGELCDVSGVSMYTGARNVKVDALEITRRGVYNAEQKYLGAVKN